MRSLSVTALPILGAPPHIMPDALTLALVHTTATAVNGVPLVLQPWRCLVRPASDHVPAMGSSAANAANAAPIHNKAINLTFIGNPLKKQVT